MAAVQPLLIDLPSEILRLVTQFCSLFDLKNLRKCNRCLARASEPRLFETVVLVPQQGSFLRLEVLSQNKRLSPLIRGLVYDPRVILHEDHFSAWNAWQNGDSFRVEDNLHRFSSVLQSLPQLKRIIVRVSDDDNILPPVFYDQMSVGRARPVRLQSVTQETMVASVADAILASGIHIEDFRAGGVRWQLFGEAKGRQMMSNEALEHVLSRIRRLELSFQRVVCRMPDDTNPEVSYHRLGSALSGRSSLEHLKIRFIHTGEWMSDCAIVLKGVPLLPPYVLGPGSQYPRLRCLDIGAYYTYPKPWMDFLSNVAPRLRSLKLANFALCTEMKFQPNTIEDFLTFEGCWVKLLKAMQSILRLDEIDFGGLLVSSGGQRWQIFEVHGPLKVLRRGSGGRPPIAEYDVTDSNYVCLKTQVKRWFINGGICPLEGEAIAGAVHYAGAKNEDRREQTWGDTSWRMV